MQTLAESVRRDIERWEGEFNRPYWPSSGPIVVGVSGGPDSVVLLHLLTEMGLYDAGDVVVGHLDHQLRATSASEAQALAGLCQNNGVKFALGVVDVAQMAERQAMTIEEAARVARYRFLAELALGVGSECIVVGHTSDDQVETVLMHILRGTGLAGLRGMLPIGPVPGFPELTLLRPLLNISRASIESYRRAQGLDAFHDLSNDDFRFFRNRLRHELMPILESYNPQIRERLLHTASVVRADSDYLRTRTRREWKSVLRERGTGYLRLDLQRWRTLPLSMRRRTLRHAVWQLRSSLRDVSFLPIEQARHVAEQGNVGAQSSLPGDVMLEVEYETLLLTVQRSRAAGPMATHSADIRESLAVPGEVILPNGWRIEAQPVANLDAERIADRAEQWQAYVDAERAGHLFVRTRHRGERMQPLGMQGKHSKVADMMVNAKIPARLRGGWPIVANASHVVWLVGIQVDERVKVHANTRRVIQLRCVKPPS